MNEYPDDRKEIRLFLFDRYMDDGWYSFRVPCAGWADADNFASSTPGVRLMGEFHGSFPAWMPISLVRFWNRVRGR